MAGAAENYEKFRLWGERLYEVVVVEPTIGYGLALVSWRVDCRIHQNEVAVVLGSARCRNYPRVTKAQEH